jgi:hypothetical protein
MAKYVNSGASLISIGGVMLTPGVEVDLSADVLKNARIQALIKSGVLKPEEPPKPAPQPTATKAT